MKHSLIGHASLKHDWTEDFLLASGLGKQHCNKVETGVCLMHQPSGLKVTSTA